MLMLIVMFIFGLFKMPDSMSIFFIIFLIAAAIFICTAFVLAIASLINKVKSTGLKSTLLSLLSRFAIISIVGLIIEYILERQFSIWHEVTFGAIVSLITTIDIKLLKSDGSKSPHTLKPSDKTSNMVPGDCENYDQIEKLVLSKLADVLDMSQLKKDEQNGYYIIDSVNDLWLEFGGSDVTIYYLKEHHHIMGMDFDTMDEWALEVDRFLRQFINRTVRFEYYFKGEKHIRIKTYSLHDGRDELIEHIRTTLNPLFLNSKYSRKEVKLIDFQQQ